MFNFYDWRKGARWAVCLGFSATLLYLALGGTDLGQVMQKLKGIHPAPAVVAVLFLFLYFFIRAWRWRYLLLPIKSVAVVPLFRSTLIGFMGNYLLPLHGGEFIRAVSIGQTQRISKSSALGTIVLERFLDGITISLTPFLLMAMLDLPSWVIQVNLLLLGIYVVGLSMIVVGTLQGWTDIWLKRLLGVFPWAVATRLSSIAEQFVQGLKGLNQARVLLPLSSLSLVCWFCHGLYYFFLFEALDLQLSIWVALILQMVLAFGVILPAGPGYVGNFEYFTILGLAMFGIAKESALAYALLAHSLQFFPVTIVGLLFGLRGGFWPQVEGAGVPRIVSSSVLAEYKTVKHGHPLANQ